jgi:hypothetical protein
MPLRFELSPPKLAQSLDWYWQFGVQRIKDHPDHALPRGSWLDSLYAVANARRPAAGERKTLAVWGPSQSGKSTLLASYLDAELKPGPKGEHSTLLTWDEAEPVTFLYRGKPGVLSLNPFAAGADASGCVTRYVEASYVKNNRYPVRLRFNSLSHVMHALACGYLSECRSATNDGANVYWDRERISKEFLKKPDRLAPGANRAAYELLREILDVVGMFIKSGEARYAALGTNWEGLRRDLLDSSDLVQSEEAAIHFASTIFWDGSPTLSGVFRCLRTKVETLRWARREVYCTMGVAALLLDIDTFKRVKAESPDDFGRETLRRIRSLGFREEAGTVLIEEGTPAAEIAGDEFGFFQALVREIVVPVRTPPALASQPFFRLLKEADILDFPGVALKDAQGNALTRLDLTQLGERDHRLLTTVFKRGKTSSIVMGYGDDVSIDAFALLIRAKTYPSKPEQLCSGIRYWWERVSPGFQSATNESAPTPLPLSVCMTFFGHVLVELAQTKPKAGVGPLFKDMLEPLTPFDRPANASYFMTTYTSFKAAGEIRLDEAERKCAVDIIKQDADFQRVFRSAESQASFDRLIADPDGGVSYFFECQLAKIRASDRMRHLAGLAERDVRTGLDLLKIAVPEVEDAGAQQKRTLAEVARAVEANLRLWETSLPRELKQFDQIEDATSLYSYWIRSLLAVEPEELEPLPLDFAQQNRESKFGYVSRQWARWRDGSVARMKKVKGFNWGLFGLRDESEARGLLKLMSEGRQLDRELVEWLTEQMGFLQVESDARVLRQELAVVLGNIVRIGCIRPGPRAAVGSLATVMRRHVSWENDLGGNADSPHYHKVIQPFLEGLQSLRPAAPQRPTLPGDAELRNLWIS